MYILRFSTQYSIFILDFVDIDFQSQEKSFFAVLLHFSLISVTPCHGIKKCNPHNASQFCQNSWTVIHLQRFCLLYIFIK